MHFFPAATAPPPGFTSLRASRASVSPGIALQGCGGGSDDSATQAAAGRPARKPRAVTTRPFCGAATGPEPDTLDPQLARTDAAFNILRDLFEGLTAVGPDGSAVPGAARVLDGLARRPRVRVQAAAGPALVERRPGHGGRLRCGLAPARRSGDRLAVRTGHRARRERARHRGRQAGTGQARRRARRTSRPCTIRLATPAPYLLGLLAQPSAAPVHAASLAANGKEYARPGKLVSNGAFVLEDWVIGSHVVLRRNTSYWNDAATTPRARAFPAHRRRGHRAAPVPRRPARRDLRRAAAAVPVDQAQPRERAARLAAAEHLLLRLQPDAAAVQEQPGPASRAVAGHRSRQAHERHHRRGRGARPTAGCRPASGTTRRSSSTTPRRPYARSASPRRASCTPPPAIPQPGRCASSCATTPATCTTGSRSRSLRCGRTRSASRPRSTPRSSRRCCRPSRRGRKRRSSARAGSATTTTPFRLRSCCSPTSAST